MSDQAPPPPRTKCSCGCGAPLRDIDGRPLDQAPAADPALDAVIERTRWHVRTQLERPSNYDKRVMLNADDISAIIRAALADRITPAEARSLLNRPSSVLPTAQVNALYAKLTGIADRDEVTR